MVDRWRKRFFEERLAGLEDRERAGRPRRFPPGAGGRGEGAGLRAAGDRDPFDRLVAGVMTVEPYCSARIVFWIVDNGSSHAGQASIHRLEGAYRNLQLIHLPVHASWLNQIELYFSIVQRRMQVARRASNRHRDE